MLPGFRAYGCRCYIFIEVLGLPAKYLFAGLGQVCRASPFPLLGGPKFLVKAKAIFKKRDVFSPKLRGILLRGPWDLVPTYNWAYNPTYTWGNPYKPI